MKPSEAHSKPGAEVAELPKKRRIIKDSDSEEEVFDNMTNAPLKITVKELDRSSSRPEQSVEDIKKQLGVDAEGLERAREALEAEEKHSTHTAYTDETGERSTVDPQVNNKIPQHCTNDELDIQDAIMDEKEKLEILKGVMKRARDPDEVRICITRLIAWTHDYTCTQALKLSNLFTWTYGFDLLDLGCKRITTRNHDDYRNPAARTSRGFIRKT